MADRLIVDYSTGRPDPADLVAAGVTAVLRYIGAGTTDKHLTPDERDQLWRAGLSIGLLNEGVPEAVYQGEPAGEAHGRLVLAALAALGVPPTVPVYTAVDVQVAIVDWPAVREYLDGFARIVGRARTGIYGSFDAMTWAARDGSAAWFYQTYAWSDGRWFAGNHLEQWSNGHTIGGAQLDYDRARRPAWGQWSPLTSRSLPMSQRYRIAGFADTPPWAAGRVHVTDSQYWRVLEEAAQVHAAMDKAGAGPIISIGPGDMPAGYTYARTVKQLCGDPHPTDAGIPTDAVIEFTGTATVKPAG